MEDNINLFSGLAAHDRSRGITRLFFLDKASHCTTIKQASFIFKRFTEPAPRAAGLAIGGNPGFNFGIVRGRCGDEGSNPWVEFFLLIITSGPGYVPPARSLVSMRR